MTSLWFEITAATPPGLVETVAALMREAAPGGVSIEEPFDALGPEQGYRVRAGEPVAIRAYVPSSELGAVLTQRLRDALAAFDEVELTARPINQEDWSVSWREFFGPVEAGRVAIVPTWVDYEASPEQVIVRIDPGQAFGTGHHETTRLCLGALSELVVPGASVLDVGTGSGVLAIAAIGLGAAEVDAYEIDPIAAEVARANCDANGAAGRAAVHDGALEHPARRYDLAVANISARADLALADTLAAAVAPGGLLILSGFLAEDRADVQGAYEARGFGLADAREEHEWVLLVLHAPSDGGAGA